MCSVCFCSFAADDPVHMFEYQTRSPNSVIKFLSDLYSCQRTANLLYTNDAKVLIDIIVRQLNDLSPGDQVLYQLILVIVNNSHKRTRFNLAVGNLRS